MNNQERILKARAQKLRKAPTAQENRLWYDFLRTYPVRFHRQQVFGSYIVDFYCHQARLVIELDGSQHTQPQDRTYDRQRTAYLNSLGLQVVRYANNQVNREFRAVCENIDHIVRTKLQMKR